MPDTCFANWPGSRERLAHWYGTPLGRELAGEVGRRAAELLDGIHGEHALQVGGAGHGSDLLTCANLGHRLYLLGETGDSLSAIPEALPLTSESLHLLVLWHVLEYRDQPREALAEAGRVLAPEGRMLIVAFNPWSLFGLRRALPHDGVPWSGRFPGRLRLYLWLRRTGLTVEASSGCWRRPPAHGARLRRWLHWLERGHRALDHCGAVQLLLVRRREARPTPIALESRWRRKLTTGRPVRPGVSACRSRPPEHSKSIAAGDCSH